MAAAHPARERFVTFLGGWLDRQQTFLDQLLNLVESPDYENKDVRQRNLIEQVMSHYLQYFWSKSLSCIVLGIKLSRLLRLLDQRYKGIAHGVAQSEILGRIHVAPIKIGSIFYPCSFMVLDAPNMEFLFWLDMLRKHRCIIDLNVNVLRVGGGEVSVPFLQEKDIPSRFLDEERFSKEASSSGAPLMEKKQREVEA
ncbi:hypothetical protein FF1_009094 [Malus domestica]